MPRKSDKMRDINEILHDIEEVNRNTKITNQEKKERLEKLGKELEEYEKTDIVPILKKINEQEVIEALKKYKKEEYLTEQEINIILNASISNAWNTLKKLGIELKRTSLNGMCKLAQELAIKPLENVGIKVTKNSAEKCFNYPQTHYFGTATFKISKNESKTYLIDPTYIQFYKEVLDKDFAKELIENGYIELTEENLKKYIKTFIKSIDNDINYYKIIKKENDIEYTESEIYDYNFFKKK